MKKAAKTVLFILKNKYLVSLVAFVILLLFFDRNDVFTQMERKKQLRELQSSKQFYQDEIIRTKQQLIDLQQNPAALEKYARENFYMKRDNEDIFLVEPAATSKKK
ncbi:FtsB family cell division protein [Filimonas effusa]|uniref:Septum formation initiator family protein n=1 Tax=Filimonas effusa TaxID=2508721 RepID=A0A4Q1D3P3_9BACT|nr:septum formation initiator family protein [Filimonas effusa]RXK81929.1 septum formation initiator family protein [Filimonas effusa]